MKRVALGVDKGITVCCDGVGDNMVMVMALCNDVSNNEVSGVKVGGWGVVVVLVV